MEEKLLEIKDLSVEYTTDEDIVKAVNHVSLTLNKGETIGLVGETGAGRPPLPNFPSAPSAKGIGEDYRRRNHV